MLEFDALKRWILVRPCVEAVIALVIGSCGAYYLIPPIPSVGTVSLSAVLMLSSLVFWIRDVRKLRILVFITFLLSGFGLAALNLWTGLPLESTGKPVIHATVRSLLSSGANFRVLLMEDGCMLPSGKLLHGYGRLTLRNNTINLSAGDRVSFRSNLRKPSNRGNPGEYDWEMDCLNEGIVWLASTKDADSVAVLERANPYRPLTMIYNLRQRMIGFLETNTGRYLITESNEQIRAVLKGIVLGDRGEISPEINRSFSDSGLVHMFSASGVHVTIVGLMTFLIVKSFFYLRPKWLLRVPLPYVASLASIPTISMYCVLVGFKPPSMRAVIMGLVLAVSILGQKKWESLNTLAFASLLIIIFYPLSFFTISFQLSFAAVAGIILLIRGDASKLLKENQSTLLKPSVNFNLLKINAKTAIDFIRKPFTSVMIVTVAATIATTPIIIQTFQRIPFWGPFANLTAEFPLSLGLTLGLIATVMGLLSPDAGALVLLMAEICIWLVLQVADFFASLPFAVIHFPAMGLPGLLFSTLGACLFFLLFLAPSRKTLLGLCACLACLFITGLASHIRSNLNATLSATFFNVGNGDAAFVRPAQTNGFLVDGGPKTEFFDAGQSIIIPFFSTKSVRQLDAIVVSHPQQDHMGGLYAAIREAPTPIIFMNQIHNHSEKLLKKQAIETHKTVQFKQADRSSPVFWLGDSRLTFINSPPNILPGKTSNAEINNSSVAMRLDYHDFSMLFMGDMEKSAEDDLLKSKQNLRATVLKVAHHAGKTSATSDSILQEIRPKIIIISADYPPRGGIPNVDVVERLQRTGAKVYWTGRDGAITVNSAGVGVTKVFLGKTRLTEIID